MGYGIFWLLIGFVGYMICTFPIIPLKITQFFDGYAVIACGGCCNPYD